MSDGGVKAEDRGMNTFKLLRSGELRTMLKLVSGAHDLAPESVLWKEHVLRGLCRLVDGRVACCSLLRDVRPGGKWTVLSRVDECFGGQRQRLVLMAAAEGNGAADPMWEMAKEEGQVVTRMRREVVDDGEWYASVYVKQVRQKAGVDDCIYSLVRLPERGWAMAMTVHRGWGGRKFGEREKAIVHALHEEIGMLYEREAGLARMMGRVAA
ncbi:MAG TPA: hypothetical protein VGQ99_01855 [Tepidisphaeraceae bacterium]|nr:hypothetical protein [Tepidisphaeraceae bacterium]